MYNNVGKYDRILRILLGLILIFIGFVFGMTYLGWTLVFVGIVSLATGVVGWCGIYSIIGFSSRGHGIDKITRKDIVRAVKEGSLNSSTINDVKMAVKDEKDIPIKKEVELNLKEKKTLPEKKTNKTSKKSVSKKKVVKKKTSAKKSQSSTKKTAPKKKAVKKTSTKKKTITKKAKK